MVGKSYVVTGATIKCSNGGKEAVLKVEESASINTSFSGLLQIPEDATKKDINIPDFGGCKAKAADGKPCREKWDLADRWDNTAPSFTGNNKKVLIDNSILLCYKCKGVITIDFHGQNSDLILSILDKNAKDITDEEYAFLAYMFLYGLNTEEKNDFIRGMYDYKGDMYINPAGMAVFNFFGSFIGGGPWIHAESSSNWSLNEEKYNKIMAAALAYQVKDNMGNEKAFQNYTLLDTVGKEMKSCVGEYGAGGPLFELSDGPDGSYIIKLQQSDDTATFNKEEYSISKTLYKDSTDLKNMEFKGDPKDAIMSFLGGTASDEMQGALSDTLSDLIFDSGKTALKGAGGVVFGIAFSVPEAMIEYNENEQARTKGNAFAAADIFGLYLVEVTHGSGRLSTSTYPVAPTQYTVDKVQAYNDWAETYGGDDFEPITPEDTLGFSDKMQRVYENIDTNDELRTIINGEMEK